MELKLISVSNGDRGMDNAGCANDANADDGNAADDVAVLMLSLVTRTKKREISSDK
jgi:hypothetical protein